MTRRSFILGFCAVWFGAIPVWAAEASPDEFVSELTRIEQASGGRLGVAMLDMQSNTVKGIRMNEVFPMCSTFKVLAVGALLAQVDAGKEQLSRRVVITKDEVLPYSPITSQHVGGEGMTLAEICKAAITRSDNTAANLVLDCVGGPVGATAYVRGLGDPVTRLDRREPDLNHVISGDPRDTTTPAAMLNDLTTLTLGNVLSPGSRKQLIVWLEATETGDDRLRAGLPKSWMVGDKTGTSHNTYNDIAVIWPPHRPPVVVSVVWMRTVRPGSCHWPGVRTGGALRMRCQMRWAGSEPLVAVSSIPAAVATASTGAWFSRRRQARAPSGWSQWTVAG